MRIPLFPDFLLLCLQFLRNNHLKIILLPHIFWSCILVSYTGVLWLVMSPNLKKQMAHEDTTVSQSCGCQSAEALFCSLKR